MSFRLMLAAAVAAFGIGHVANAAPLTGQISLTGYVAAIGSVSTGAATGLDFVGGPSGSRSPDVAGAITDYGGGYGAFAGLSCSSAGFGCGSIKDIDSFSAFKPISDFLTFKVANGSDITFDLSSIDNIARTQDDTGGTLGLTASGTIHYAGYDDTAGSFLLTTQGNEITSFSATTLSAQNVPEPMSLALLGGSLVAIGLIRTKRA